MHDPLFPDEEPTPEFQLMARSLRQMYVALCQTGFTEAQAMNIIGVTIASSVNPNPPSA